jgi:hypothetical protein
MCWRTIAFFGQPLETISGRHAAGRRFNKTIAILQLKKADQLLRISVTIALSVVPYLQRRILHWPMI